MRPGNGEGHVAPHDAAPKSHPIQHSYSEADRLSDQVLDDGRKHFTTLRAKLALSGYSLLELSCDGYLITRWNLTRPAPDLRAVGQFLRQIGGAHG